MLYLHPRRTAGGASVVSLVPSPEAETPNAAIGQIPGRPSSCFLLLTGRPPCSLCQQVLSHVGKATMGGTTRQVDAS